MKKPSPTPALIGSAGKMLDGNEEDASGAAATLSTVVPPSRSRPPDLEPSSRLTGLAATLRSHSGFADVVASLEEGHGGTIGGT
ncbi:MAG: hypothetical protein DWH79_12710, partial [Planctomycetota bacterium]